MQSFSTCLWFDSNAVEAAEFYVSLFPDSRITATTYYNEAGPGPAGSVMAVEWILNGQTFMGINGGPLFSFSEAFSVVVNCDDQAEIDHYWDALIAGGGEHGPCGWLKDRFGFSWQVVPTILAPLMSDGSEGAVRMNKAMLQMGKLDIAALQAAYDGD